MSQDVSSLARWGLDDHFKSEFEQPQYSGSILGRVTRADSARCNAATEQGEVPAAYGLKLNDTPITGDWVALLPGSSGEHRVAAVLPRRTAVTRASFRTLEQHVMAANVDHVMVVTSLAAKLRLRRVERLLVLAWQTGAVPTVVLTKSDLIDDASAALREVASVAGAASQHAVSALTGEGMAGLESELYPGTTAVMIGPSGTGKSTLANALTEGGGKLETQPVRSDSKGRHTTVTRELVVLRNGALLIDTPGLRAVGLVDDEEALADAFMDIEQLAQSCRFRDCSHITEPDCEVLKAVAQGLLSQERIESYGRLQRDQVRIAAQTDARLRAERTAEWRRFSREQRRQYRR